jgi:hypothetical protein
MQAEALVVLVEGQGEGMAQAVGVEIGRRKSEPKRGNSIWGL